MNDYSTHRCQQGRCDEFFCYLSEWCSPQPMNEYEHALVGIPAMDEWLQEESRTTSQVTERLFPSISHLARRNQQALLQAVGWALFDTGYTPQDAKVLETTWHWRDGRLSH